MIDLAIQVLLACLGGAVVAVAVNAAIDAYTIRKKVKEQFIEAAKVIINETDIRSVTVGIYDHSDRQIKEMKLSSEKGIASDLKQGQVIYL